MQRLHFSLGNPHNDKTLHAGFECQHFLTELLYHLRISAKSA